LGCLWSFCPPTRTWDAVKSRPQAHTRSSDTAGCWQPSVVVLSRSAGQQLPQPTCSAILRTEPTSSPAAANGSFHSYRGRGFCYTRVYPSLTSLSTSPAANLLAHDNVQLVLHLGVDAGCDSGSQLLGAALEGADELSKLIQQWVPRLLFSYLLVLQVSLQLLDICNKQRGRLLHLRYWWGSSGQKSGCQALHVIQQNQLLSQCKSAGERGKHASLVLGCVTLT